MERGVRRQEKGMSRGDSSKADLNEAQFAEEAGYCDCPWHILLALK
jgi:hypothetical protein